MLSLWQSRQEGASNALAGRNGRKPYVDCGDATTLKTESRGSRVELPMVSFPTPPRHAGPHRAVQAVISREAMLGDFAFRKLAELHQV